MADVFYPGTLAADPGTVGRSPLPNAVFQVFELTDTAQVNPLPLKDSSGLSITSLASTSLGVLPPVYVTSPNLSHNWVSGTWVWRRDSFDGAQAAVTAAKNASISGASLSPAGDLSFTTLGGTVIPAGNVKGPQGSPGSNTVPTDTAIKNVVTDPASQTAGALNATYVGLIQAAKNPDLLIAGAVTLDGSDQVTSAAVQWPDGTPGTLTITARHATGAVTNYNITYGSPVTKTFTQPTITRNANGAATNVPQIVVS